MSSGRREYSVLSWAFCEEGPRCRIESECRCFLLYAGWSLGNTALRVAFTRGYILLGYRTLQICTRAKWYICGRSVTACLIRAVENRADKLSHLCFSLSHLTLSPGLLCLVPVFEVFPVPIPSARPAHTRANVWHSYSRFQYTNEQHIFMLETPAGSCQVSAELCVASCHFVITWVFEVVARYPSCFPVLAYYLRNIASPI